jgi:hypothetical protein
MNQSQTQSIQRVSSQRSTPAGVVASSMSSLRTAALSLLVDRALSA